MNNTTSSIITIGREYGSAGRQIGQEVARYFGIKCYDKELLEHAANDSGICKELFENHDERPTNSFLYSLVMDTYSFGYSSAGFTDMPMNHKVFLAQFEAIKKLAAEGPCVMVGRCADYALADNKDCFSVFVHADLDWRIKRIAGKYNKTPKEAKDMITKQIRAVQVTIITTPIRNGVQQRATAYKLTAVCLVSKVLPRRLSIPYIFLMTLRNNIQNHVKIRSSRKRAPFVICCISIPVFGSCFQTPSPLYIFLMRH